MTYPHRLVPPPVNLPFAGICHRPYSQDFLSNVNRVSIKPELVAFKDIWLTQEVLTIKGIFGERFSSDVFPHIVSYFDVFYLEDGTHRVVLNALEGGTAARMRVIDWHKYHG